MSNLCVLERTNSGGPFPKRFTTKSYNDMATRWSNLIDPILDKLDDGEINSKLFLLAFKQALRDFGKLMHARDIDANTEYILYWMEQSDQEWIQDYIPAEGLKNAISKKYQEQFGESLAQYDEEVTDDDTYVMPSKFLEDKFGTNATLKNQLKLEISHKFINTFIIDRENGRIIQNATDANISARRHKQDLFNKVSDYLGIPRKDLFNPDGSYTGAFTSEVFKKALREKGQFDIWELPNIEQAAANSDQSAYDAFKAWFTLKNYDNFLNLFLGSAVVVNPEAKGKLANGDVYTFADKHGANITSWKTDDNTVLSQVISSLAQSLVITTPALTYGNLNPTGHYLKFEDFYRTITKMKDLVILGNPEMSTPIKTQFASLYNSDNDLLPYGNLSLRQIINGIRLNPLQNTRVALKLLTSDYNLLKSTLKFDDDFINKIYSVYQGIYSLDNRSSINRIQNQVGTDGKKVYSHNSQDYYSLISLVADSLFSVKFLQYNDSDSVITVRTLNDLSSDNTRRAIEQNIALLNSRRIINLDFENLHMKPYNARLQYNPDHKITGLRLNVGSFEFEVKDMGKEFKIYKYNNVDGKLVKGKLSLTLLEFAKTNPNSLDYVEVLNFIDQQLGINIAGDPRMMLALGLEYKDAGQNDTLAQFKAINDVAKLASVVLMNKIVSNTRLHNKRGYHDIVHGAEAAYAKNTPGNYLPRYNADLNELNLIPDVFLDTVKKIALAKTRVTGEAQSTLVKTADGDMLSQQTLSRLIGNLTSQWEEIRRTNGAASGFSLLQPGVYQGHFTSKELKSPLGNKAETQFTVAELAQGAFLYDFVGGLLPTNKKSEYGNGKVGFYPSVNSDKGTIGRIIIDINLRIVTGPFAGKTFNELTNDELLQLTGIELGEAYEKSFNIIKSDYNRLTSWLSSLGINTKINPETNFMEFNEYASLLGSKPLNLLFEWTRQYNNANPTNPIRLIENVHYIKGADGILFNNTYRALRARYGNINNLKRFMDFKRTELVSALLSEGAEFNLTQEGETIENTPKKYLLELKEWIGVRDLDPKGNVIRSVDNGRMVIAKISHKGSTYNITSKQDLMNFAAKHKISGEDLLNNPHKLLNYNIQLHPTLDKYNLMDYLFTQEFMMSGVGSHIAHPSKTKIKKTPIIWGHPGLGKSYSEQNGLHANEFMDWDTEFNHLRDQWIETHTGISKYIGLDKNPAFEDTKNNILINWRSNKEFTDFVKLSWKNIKAKAQSQNKMLFASPAMLLELFPQDFNLVIDMEDSDFIEREKNRGDVYLEKLNINPILLNFKMYNATDKYMVVLKGKYLEDIFNDGTLLKFQDIILDNEIQEEAARFLALHKRNVSYTAQMQEFHLGQLNGVPTYYNMAMMEDVPAYTYTISGDTNTNDSYDGATFVNPYVVHWENNSLNSARAGIDKKQFVHFYDEVTGTGGIVKTAGFGVTNDRIRRYTFYRTMNKNMTNRNWFNEDGSLHIMQGMGILQDFEGRDVDYGEIYFKKGDKYYYREINEYLGSNTYSITDYEVDEFGHILDGKGSSQNISVNNNYLMWEMFGGMRSMSEVNGKLQYSEASIENVAKAASNYGIKKNAIARTQDDVYLPMKHADIHYMPTKGAVKQGACNINPWSSFFNEVLGGVNFMRVKMTQAGIQLDKEHHANDSVLSLMTQVISAACSRGLMPNTSVKVYEALYELTKIGTKNFRDELGKLNIGENLDPEASEKFSAAITDVMMKTILNSTATDGDMMQSIARKITAIMDSEGVYKFDPASLLKYDELIPYSSPEIFRKVVTALTTAMTKKGIKTKMPGVLSVLCPAHDIVKFYKVPVDALGNVTIDKENIERYKRVTLEQLEDAFGIEPELLEDTLCAIQAKEDTFTDIHEGIEIGYRYLLNRPILDDNGNIQLVDGKPQYELVVVHVVRPNDVTDKKGNWPSDGRTNYKIGGEVKSIPCYKVGYTQLKRMVNEYKANGYSYNFQEWAKDGQDLHSYQVKFSDGVNNFQIGDLDIVQEYFVLKDLEAEGNKSQIEVQNDFLLPLIFGKYNKGQEFINRVSADLLGNRATKQSPATLFHYALVDAAISVLGQPGDFNTNLNNALITTSSNFKIALSDKNDSVTRNAITLRVKDQFVRYINKMGIGFMNRTMLQTLNAISPTYNEDVIVKVDGRDVAVKKDSIKVLAYGIIMPKVFKENFGLDTFDAVEDIMLDPEFFTKKIVKKFATKVNHYPLDEEGIEWLNNFDLELKRNDGNHIYVRFGTQSNRGGNSEVCDLSQEIHWFKQIDPDGKVYRIDSNKHIMYEMFSENDKIYRDDEGNEIIVPASKLGEFFEDADGNHYERASVIQQRNGDWVLKKNAKVKVTLKVEDPTLFYLNNFSYATLNISTYSPDSVVKNILEKMKDSTNKQANRYYNIVTREDGMSKRRSIIEKLNDYTGALGDNKTNSYQLEHISELGKQIYTSFLRSRDLVAARIPSQNQQSFMAMEVEAFDNPDINTAYVSIFQFFLQGSDLDIDAVSLLVFDIDESGLFVGHSPYYSLNSPELRKASENIPFPNGRGALITKTERLRNTVLGKLTSQYPGFLGRTIASPLVINMDKKGNVRVDVHLNNIGGIEQLSQFIEDVNAHGITIPTEDSMAEAGKLISSMLGLDGVLSAEQTKLLFASIIKVVDDHNLYIKRLDGKNQERLIKNYAITQLYNIIKDPVNLLESWSSVDTVTAPVKDLAKKSPKATVQNMFSPGNFMNKFLSLSENMVGKDGIAICATGLKTFFGITSMYSKILNDPNIDPKEKDMLLHSVTIGGKTYMGLANAFSPKFKSVFESINVDNDALFTQKMLNFLLDQLWAPDATADMSAMLGLSADNAKELVLAKINAGTATLGMYLYGMAIGVPIDTLYNIINSKLGRRLTELTKGDFFNGDVGTRNIIGALLYLSNEPSLRLFKSFLTETKVESPGEAVLLEIRKAFAIEAKEQTPLLKLSKELNIQSVKLKIETLRGEVSKYAAKFKKEANNTESRNYIAQYNRAIDAILLFIDDRQLLSGSEDFLNTIYGPSSIYTNLEVLATGAEEMKTAGKIFHLNQEIYTTPDKLIDLVSTIENLIEKRVKLISKQNSRSLFIPTPKYDRNDNFSLDLARFMTDDDYAADRIAKYDEVAQSFNALRVIKYAPNYTGYVESLLTAHYSLLEKSAKLKAIIGKGFGFIDKWGVVDPNLAAKVIKNTENAVDLFIREKWMLENGFKITIPASTSKRTSYAFIDNPGQPRINYANRDVYLGTPLGDANFKLWMERIVIPDLKLKYPDNKFILDLTPILVSTSDAGVKTINHGLRINMMPKPLDEYAVDLFNLYKEAFNDLTKVDPYTSQFRVLDLLYLYSLIAYKGKQGPNSLHSIFLDYNSSILDSYRAYISKVDRDSSLQEELFRYITDEMLAPIGNPNRGGSNLMKYVDKKTDIPYLIELEDKESRELEDMSGAEEAGINPEDLLYFGAYVPRAKTYSEMDYSMFNTARQLSGISSITAERYDTRFYGTNVVIEPSKVENGQTKEYKVVSIDLGDHKLNMKAMKLLKDVPSVVMRKEGAYSESPNLDIIYQIIEDIKNGCV